MIDLLKKIKVTPILADGIGDFVDEQFGFCIKVSNSSNSDITISEIGFMDKKSNIIFKALNPMISSKTVLPALLEKKTSLTAYFCPELAKPELIYFAYILLETGEIIKGRNADLISLNDY